MALDFIYPIPIIGMNCKFKTLKPLCFIARYDGYWTVFTLQGFEYRNFKKSFYCMQRYRTYQKARDIYKSNISYFERYSEFNNWPAK